MDHGQLRRFSCWLVLWLSLTCLALSRAAAAGGNGASEMRGENAFAVGNRYYENGRYAEAITAYQESIQHGEASANLFYNLGNAAFRAGEAGRAVLNYERALRLQPSHQEAAANLAFVRRQLGLPANAAPEARATTTAHSAATFGPWLLAAGGWLLAAGALVSGLTAARRGGWTLGASGATLLLAGGAAMFWLADPRWTDPARAVVVGTEGAEARYAPADTSDVVATLPTGGEVRVLQERGAWDYVELASKARAWIAASQVERIAPSFQKP
ncbi:MAG: tetratricopeptide repeat protein [Verrucomicrobia bacterium]|nr:tetratricopeptide repeat protein [Verrucomicrobiota bacterium]